VKRFLPLLVLATVAPASVQRAPPSPAVRAAPLRAASAPISPSPVPPPLAEPVTVPSPELATIPADDEPPPLIKGQDEAAYRNRLARDPAMRAEVGGFESFLKGQGLQGVLPTWQLTRTASDYAKCDGPAFQVAPIAEWQHLAETLRFIKKHVQPVIGDVEAMSGYRNEELNKCAGGAKESAHRHFFALDLVPKRNIARAGLIRSLCAIQKFRGRGYKIGLGFYNGLRFHLDSKGFRRWGPDGKGATSPCVTGI